MSSNFSFSTLLALPMLLAAFAAPAQAAPSGYCTFTSPASIACPGVETQAQRAPAPQPVRTVSADHCIAASPASAACPAAPLAKADAFAGTPLRVSSK